MRNYKKLLIIFFILSFLLLVPVSFATSIDENLNSTDDNIDDLNIANLEDNKVQNKTVFIISDSPGTNILDSASNEIYNEQNLSGFNIVLRSGEQVKDMDEEELHSLFSSSDAFIGEWISTDVDSVLTNLLGKYPDLSHKELFLILELPSGNLNSGSSSLNLIRNNTLNYTKIFSSYTNDELIDYFKNTKKGTFTTAINFAGDNTYKASSKSIKVTIK